MTNTFEIHSGCGKFGDAQQARNVGFAVATIAASGASRREQTATFVDAQCLRVHTS
jgi:hypothetical protein